MGGKIKLGTGTEDDAIVMLHFVSLSAAVQSLQVTMTKTFKKKTKVKMPGCSNWC